ncbi:MAG: pyridoxamine 5'-phosphate oxidase family protein [Acidimicrobiia bacterium]
MSPREPITMAPGEVDEFLRTRRHVALATLDPDGAPEVAIARCRYEDRALLLTLDASSPALAAIGADDRVCCAAESCSSYYEIRGVSVHGRAQPRDDGTVIVRSEHVTSFDFAKIRERPE